MRDVSVIEKADLSRRNFPSKLIGARAKKEMINEEGEEEEEEEEEGEGEKEEGEEEEGEEEEVEEEERD